MTEHPDSPEAGNDNLSPIIPLIAAAEAFTARGEHDRAVDKLDAALKLDPDSADAWFTMGQALMRLSMFQQAENAFRQTIRCDDNHLRALNMLGSALTRLGQYDEAIKCLSHAVKHDKQRPEIRLNLGVAYAEAGRGRLARIHLEQALRLRPDYAEAHAVIGNVDFNDGNLAASVERYRQALALRPNDPHLRLNAALIYLTAGEIEDGWDCFEARLDPGAGQPIEHRHELARWRGEDLGGKSLLVAAEQGLGDQIQFASCIPDLSAAAAKLHIEVEPRLVELFQRSFPEASVHAQNLRRESRLAIMEYPWLTPEAGIDLAVPIASLPLYLRKRAEGFPCPGAYLKPDPVRRAAWRERLDALGPTIKIGVNWRSGRLTALRAKFYTGIEDWGPIIGLAAQHLVQFINLQYDDCDEELAKAKELFGCEIHDFVDLDQWNDLDGVAALISELDFAICAPTVVSIIAGSVGPPAVMLGYGQLQCGLFPSAFQPAVQPFGGADKLDRAAAALVDFIEKRAAFTGDREALRDLWHQVKPVPLEG
jgi:tetratricopeptide (TPR) repeat protein